MPQLSSAMSAPGKFWCEVTLNASADRLTYKSSDGTCRVELKAKSATEANKALRDFIAKELHLPTSKVSVEMAGTRKKVTLF